MEQQVIDQPQIQDPSGAHTEPTPTPAAPADPFGFDPNAIAGLPPEQRTTFENSYKQWRAKAEKEISDRDARLSELNDKYKPVQERADALERLTKYQPFVQWWNQQQSQAQNQNPGQANQIANTKPENYASQAEWSEAVLAASNGDGTKLQEIQARMMSAWATPFVKQLTEKQQVIETQMNLRDLFETHPDAKDLDAIGIDPKTKEGVSLLEQALDWAERNGKTMEEGYQLGRRWANQFKVGAQQQAMGLVNSKKSEITAGPSTNASSANVVIVDNTDELIKRSMDAQLNGQKDVRFVLRGK